MLATNVAGQIKLYLDLNTPEHKHYQFCIRAQCLMLFFRRTKIFYLLKIVYMSTGGNFQTNLGQILANTEKNKKIKMKAIFARNIYDINL